MIGIQCKSPRLFHLPHRRLRYAIVGGNQRQRVFSLLVAFALAPGLVKAQVFPAKPVRLVVGLGPTLSMLQARVFGMLPGKLITRDNVHSMSIPNISDRPFPAIFGRAAAIEGVVPAYLGREAAGGRTRYQQFRNAAGR